MLILMLILILILILILMLIRILTLAYTQAALGGNESCYICTIIVLHVYFTYAYAYTILILRLCSVVKKVAIERELLVAVANIAITGQIDKVLNLRRHLSTI